MNGAYPQWNTAQPHRRTNLRPSKEKKCRSWVHQKLPGCLQSTALPHTAASSDRAFPLLHTSSAVDVVTAEFAHCNRCTVVFLDASVCIPFRAYTFNVFSSTHLPHPCLPWEVSVPIFCSCCNRVVPFLLFFLISFCMFCRMLPSHKCLLQIFSPSLWLMPSLQMLLHSENFPPLHSFMYCSKFVLGCLALPVILQ